MEYYSGSGNRIMIGHFPGQTKYKEEALIKELKERMFVLPENIGFVTPITKDQAKTSPLLYQIKKNNYENRFYNSLSDRNMVWHSSMKVKYVLDSLLLCREEYALVLDGNDVVILTDLTDIFDRFDSYGKKILYNASIWMHPHVIVDNVKNRGRYGQYCYLNAGCCFGKTADLADFYKYAYESFIKDKRQEYDSEQYYIRKAFDRRQGDVFFDYDCRIFQCWHKQEYKYDGDRCTLL